MRFSQLIIVLIFYLSLTGCGSVEVGEQENISTQEEGQNSVDYKTKFMNEDTCSVLLDKEFLEICYDNSKKVAKSVAYVLYGDLVNELNIQERPSFYEEESIEKSYRAKVSDYTGSGYDRGHMAPDASFDWSQESLDATYSLANIIPQVPEVNQQMWVKAEAYAREVAVELGEINIINVVKYGSSPKYIGESHIAVSLGYYKILFNEDKDFEACYYYANDAILQSYSDKLEEHKVDCSSVAY
ncbi:DNA/RNA non-specific endonuclease [Patescibacteria group bacterium]|nr:DNA/RNA non-specific endonuclease [Patescibacteria group bacterium]MBU1957357.1 DNA/RNA non-specific endonuclease [bacterium]